MQGRAEQCCGGAGTATTAVLAVRIPQAQYIAPLETDAELEDGVGLCRERVAAAKREADKAKSQVGLRQAVRQDMRVRAKVQARATLSLSGGSSPVYHFGS